MISVLIFIVVLLQLIVMLYREFEVYQCRLRNQMRLMIARNGRPSYQMRLNPESDD